MHRFAAVLALLLLSLPLLTLPAAPAARAAASLSAPAAATCETTAPSPAEQRLPAEQRTLLALARQLPLNVKVGQLLMPGFVGLSPDPGLLDRARRDHVGGFFLLERNVRDADQVRDLLSQLSDAAAETSMGLLPFMATDFEGGTVNTLQRIVGRTQSAAQMASLGVAGVQARGAQDAGTLKSLGFTTDLAPVADVLTVPSGVIGTRAFSSDPGSAAALSRAYLRGLQSNGVFGVMKHFPGHGGTEDDSHVLLPTVDRSREDLQAIDLVPYRQAFAAGEAQAVMVGHLLVPALDPELPTSLSPRVVNGLLRQQLGFDGLVMTDELKMGAISGEYGVTQAAIMAINAGVDVILADYTGAEQSAVAQTLMRACQDGTFPTGRLEQSVARVLRLKLAYGLAGPDVSARYAALLGIPAPSASPAAPEAPATPAPPPAPDYGGAALADLPGAAAGRFYVDAGPRPPDADPEAPSPFGYSITDEGGIALWSSYTTLGGPAQLGYPISQRFQFGDSIVQLTQRALLRWDPQQETASPANVMDLFDSAGALLAWPGCAAGASDGNATGSTGSSGAATPAGRGDAASSPRCRLDDWLASKGIPPSIPDDGAGGDPRAAMATRLSWLTNEQLRAAFLADPAGGSPEPWPGDDALAAGLADTPDTALPLAAIARYGLPTSQPQRFGPFLTQRFQRAVLQLWLDEVSGMPSPGTVSVIPVGELFRDAGFVPPDALVATTLDGSAGLTPTLTPPPAPPAPVPAPTPVPTTAPTAVSSQPTPTAPPAPTATVPPTTAPPATAPAPAAATATATRPAATATVARTPTPTTSPAAR